MLCRNCGADIPQGGMFCPGCGARAALPGRDAPADAPREDRLPENRPGAGQPRMDLPRMDQPREDRLPENRSREDRPENAPKKKGKGKLIALILAGIATVAALAVLIPLLIRILNPNIPPIDQTTLADQTAPAVPGNAYHAQDLNFMLYKGEGGLYLVYLEDLSAKKLTAKDIKSHPVFYSEGSDRLVFGTDQDDGSFTLWGTEAGSPDTQPRETKKIASDVREYSMADDGNTLYYIKDDSLYAWDFVEEYRKKIWEDVDRVFYGADSSAGILFTSQKDELTGNWVYTAYFFNRDQDSYVCEKIAEGFSYDYEFSEDMTAFAYLKDGVIHSVVNGKETFTAQTGMDEDDDISIFYVGSDGSVAYEHHRMGAGSVSLKEYVPDLPDVYGDDLSFDELNRSVVLLDANGKEVQRLVHVLDCEPRYRENLGNILLVHSVSPDVQGAVPYAGYAQSDEYDTLGEYVLSELGVKASLSVVINGTVNEIVTWDYADFSYYDIDLIQISRDGSVLTVLTDLELQEEVGDLLQAKISGNKVGAPQKVASNVRWCAITDSGDILNLRGTDREGYSLYINDKKIDDGVIDLEYDIPSDGSVLYYKPPGDWEESTLYLYNGSGSLKLGEDVRHAVGLSAQSVFFMEHWDSEGRMGELKYYNGGEITKLADGVSSVFLPANYEYYYETY